MTLAQLLLAILPSLLVGVAMLVLAQVGKSRRDQGRRLGRLEQWRDLEIGRRQGRAEMARELRERKRVA